VLCRAETWEALDEAELRRLVDEGLRRVIAERDSRDPQLLLTDPEYRLRNVAYGIAAGMSYFTGLLEFLDEQGTINRILGFGDVVIGGIRAGSGIKRRDQGKLKDPLRLSFGLGVSVGLLDQLGELPPTMPARLP
jgi:hypothetical protein